MDERGTEMFIGSQFLRELHFIEASASPSPNKEQPCRSSSGNCTSLRRFA